MKKYRLLLITEMRHRELLRRFGVAIHSENHPPSWSKDIAYGKCDYQPTDLEALNFQTEYVRNGTTIFVGCNVLTEAQWRRMRDLLAEDLCSEILYCLWIYDGDWVKTCTDNTGAAAKRPQGVLVELGITAKEGLQ